MLLGKSILKICRKFTGEQTCQSVISVKLLYNFIQIALQHGCSPVNLLHIFKTHFLKNTSGRLFLEHTQFCQDSHTLQYIRLHRAHSPQFSSQYDITFSGEPTLKQTHIHLWKQSNSYRIDLFLASDLRLKTLNKKTSTVKLGTVFRKSYYEKTDPRETIL